MQNVDASVTANYFLEISCTYKSTSKSDLQKQLCKNLFENANIRTYLRQKAENELKCKNFNPNKFCTEAKCPISKS